jgi:hypothetical protein
MNTLSLGLSKIEYSRHPTGGADRGESATNSRVCLDRVFELETQPGRFPDRIQNLSVGQG